MLSPQSSVLSPQSSSRADRRRVLMIGIDSAPPELVFGQLRDELPVLSGLFERGLWGPLESSIPAITVPAWMTAMTSKDPGQLGIYGFRNRADYSYDKLTMATSLAVQEDTVWDILGRAGQTSIVMAVPPAFPPKPVRGSMIGCFLTPSDKSQYTYPPTLRDEIARLVGEYLVDVMNFRTDDKEYVRRACFEMTERRFEVIRHLMANREWDLFAAVEIGSDRIQHGLWRDHDVSHPRHDPDSPFVTAIRDYYRMIDDQIGSPTLADNLAQMVLALGTSRTRGIFNTVGASIMSRYDFARLAADTFGLDAGLIDPVSTASLNQLAPRPLRAGLKMDRFRATFPDVPVLTAAEGLAVLRDQLEVAPLPPNVGG